MEKASAATLVSAPDRVDQANAVFCFRSEAAIEANEEVTAAVVVGLLLLWRAGTPLAEVSDLSTPEKVIEACYSALNRADATALNATLLTPGDASRMGLGVPTTYRIIEMKKTLRSNMIGPTVGGKELVEFQTGRVVTSGLSQ